MLVCLWTAVFFRAEGHPKPRIVRLSKYNSKLDAVVITHGHLDHTGRLPLLAKLGYKGPVFATEATQEMASLILRDAARIQQQDCERQNRKRDASGEPPREPLYSSDDVEAIIRTFKTAPYQKPVTIAPVCRRVSRRPGTCSALPVFN